MFRGPYGRLAIELNMSPFLKYCINRINTCTICFHFFYWKATKMQDRQKRTGYWYNYTTASHIICIEYLYQGAFVTIREMILIYSNKFEIAVTYIFISYFIIFSLHMLHVGWSSGI